MSQLANSSVNEDELLENEEMQHQGWEWRRLDSLALKGESWA